MIPHAQFASDWMGLPVTHGTRRVGDARMGGWVVGGTPGGEAVEGIYRETVRVHPITRGVAYVARRGAQHVVVQNQQVSEPFEAVWLNSLYLTPNGDGLFFLAERAGRTVFVVNGQVQREFEQVLEVKPLGLGGDGTACGLDVATVRGERIRWQGVMPRVPEFRLGKG